MKLIYFVLSFGFGLFSCNKENKNVNDLVNDGILSKEETISILDELILIETHLQSKYYSFSNYGEALAISRDSILKSKNTNIRQFNKSFNHYAKTDKELIDIYENVLNNYNEKSAKAIIIQK